MVGPLFTILILGETNNSLVGSEGSFRVPGLRVMERVVVDFERWRLSEAFTRISSIIFIRAG